MFGCFIHDEHGIASIDEIGENNIMCETDYPHSDSTWPDCIETVQHQIGHLDPELQYKLLRGNAERLYRFTPAEAAGARPPMTPLVVTVDRELCMGRGLCMVYAPGRLRPRRRRPRPCSSNRRPLTSTHPQCRRGVPDERTAASPTIEEGE